MTLPTNPLDEIAALLASASTTPIRDARAVFLAVARARLEKTAERLRELRWLLETQERELARLAEPVQEPLPAEGRSR